MPQNGSELFDVNNLALNELKRHLVAENTHRKENKTMEWITEENPEEENVYLVTWRGKLWTDSYMGFCEWDGTRWLIEDFEPYKKYKGENIIITAWSDIEPYKDR